MIAKIMNRVDFGGLVNYAFNGKGNCLRRGFCNHSPPLLRT